jgi:hypothetical protein
MHIPLTQGQFAEVDDDDFDWLMLWKWHASWNPTGRKFYACRSSPRDTTKPKNQQQRKIWMHEIISGGPRPDHKDRDGLNNRRSNLRPATRSQNSANRRLQSNNTTGLRNVTLSRGRWRVRIQVRGKKESIGSFGSIEEAAAASNAAALKCFGEFAQLNKI